MQVGTLRTLVLLILSYPEDSRPSRATVNVGKPSLKAPRDMFMCSYVSICSYVHVLWRAWERHTGYLVLDALAFVRGPWMLVQFINPTHIILKTSAHQETLNPTALDCRSGKWFFLIFIQVQLIKWSPAPCGVCITLTPWVTVESGRDTSLFWTWSLTILAPSDGYEPHKNHTGRGSQRNTGWQSGQTWWIPRDSVSRISGRKRPVHRSKHSPCTLQDAVGSRLDPAKCGGEYYLPHLLKKKKKKPCMEKNGGAITYVK